MVFGLFVLSTYCFRSVLHCLFCVYWVRGCAREVVDDRSSCLWHHLVVVPGMLLRGIDELHGLIRSLSVSLFPHRQVKDTARLIQWAAERGVGNVSDEFTDADRVANSDCRSDII